MLQSVLTGAGVKLLINGAVVGFATGITINRSQNVKYIYEIDSPYAIEIMPTSYTVGGTLTGIRLRGNGGLDGPGIMGLSNIQDLFFQKYCNIEVIDRQTSKINYSIQNVLFDQDSWAINSKNVITFSANFKGIYMQTEVGGADTMQKTSSPLPSNPFASLKPPLSESPSPGLNGQGFGGG